MTHVFESTGHTGRSVVLENRKKYKLIDPSSDNQTQVRASGPVVLRIREVDPGHLELVVAIGVPEREGVGRIVQHIEVDRLGIVSFSEASA